MQLGGVAHSAEGVAADEEVPRTEVLRNAAVAEDSLAGVAAVMHSEAAQGEDGRTGRRYCHPRLSINPLLMLDRSEPSYSRVLSRHFSRMANA